MAPRLNKRQQRELEELENLGSGSGTGVDNEDSTEEEVPAPLGKPTAFSNFLAAEEPEVQDGEDGEEDGSVKPSSKSRKKKKKKKGVASTTEPTTPAAPTPPAASSTQQDASTTSKAERKAAKKARAKEKKGGGQDEIEQALAELSVKYPDLQKVSLSSSPTSSNTLASLLSVSLSHLDAESEMRKFFGSKVIAASKSSPGSSSGPGLGGGGGASRRAGAAQRSNLTKPQPAWWSASQREGLSIRALTSEEVEEKKKRHGWGEEVEENWWTVEYSQRYKSMTKGFIAAVMTGHPEALWEVQRRLPWHADNLLQMAEIFRHREEHAQAVDFVDRALFAYERAFIGAFNFTSGANRLDFDRVENRPFYLAVHRQVSDLQRRGCVRTAFEFARLLYGLDPWVDPHGAIHHLEILALKAGMSRWVVDVFEYFEKRRERGEAKRRGKEVDMRLDPSVLPGFMYARALGMKILEDGRGDADHEKSTAALKDAIMSYPSVVPLLADKVDVTLPMAVASHSDFRIEPDGRSLSESVGALHLLSHMYALRSSGIWKESDHLNWFTTTINALSTSLPSTTLLVTAQKQALLSLLSSNENIRYSIYRHVVVLESTHKRLFSFIPAPVLAAAKSSLACDPLPPPPTSTAVSSYDEAYFAQVEDLPALLPRQQRQRGGERRRAVDARMLAQILPDAEARRQLEEMVEGNEELMAQFPGGLREVVERLGLEGLEALMMAGVVGGGGVRVLGGVGGPGDGMPGGFGGEDMDMAEGVEGEGEDEDEDEDEDEEEVSLLPRIIRNLVGRLWGGGEPQQEPSDEENVSEHGGID